MTCRKHVWERLPKWSGRYRCSVCGALGYRGIVQANIQDGANDAAKIQIIPYVCQTTDCAYPAVGRNPQACWHHARMAEQKAERKEARLKAQAEARKEKVRADRERRS